jgi:hypothetical protein
MQSRWVIHLKGGALSGMGQGLEKYRHLARTGQGEEDMAVSSIHVISKDDDRIVKLSYDLAITSGKRGQWLSSLQCAVGYQPTAPHRAVR